jgi:hypothetical protein
MVVMVFTQYSTGMGICLNLDETGAPTLDPLAVNLSFTHCLFYVIVFPASPVARAAECLTCRI